jgi:hypothetical protein
MLTVAALQQFLRSLGAPLGAAGVTPHTLAPLEQCAAALDPFRAHTLDTLTDLLRRADEARRNGTVPLVEVPIVTPLSKTANELGEQALELATASDERAGELERDLNKNRHELQAALSALAEQFGIAVKCTEVPNWSALVRGRAVLKRLKQSVTSAEAYAGATADVAQLLALGDPVLKALAGENGLTTKAKGAKLADELLLAVTGHARPGAAKAKASKTKAPAVDPAAVAELVTVFKEKAASAEQNPYAVSDAEVGELMGRLKKLPAKSQQEVASTVIGKKITKTTDAVLGLRDLLDGVRQKHASQNS